MTEKFFLFDNGNSTHGDRITPEVIGFKAFNLMRMARIGLPIPPGFVISTEYCHEYISNNKQLPINFEKVLQQSIQILEKFTGCTFAGPRKPLLVSVRSGAAISMPGMMSTILNIGLSHETVEGLLRMTGNPRFIWDSYRRLIQYFAEVVYGCSADPYENVLDKQIKKEELHRASELDAETLKMVVEEYLGIFSDQVGFPFPQRPIDQLRQSIEAVFNSWESSRCIEFRKIHKIRNLLGTAVTIQTMVFGNMGLTSGSGVAFTRNPSTGAKELYGEFLFNSQGEDIVSGRRTPQGLGKLGKWLPNIQQQLNTIGNRLEIEFKDMQEFEFTIQEENLFILQSRNGKKSPWATLQTVVDMVNEGLISKDAAMKRLKLYDLSDVKRTKIVRSLSSNTEAISSGISACPGIAIGEVTFDSETAKEKSSSGKSIIFVRDNISTTDLVGIIACQGILTRTGGKTSHAAVVARQMNKACIVGCSGVRINMKDRTCQVGDKLLKEGDIVSLDGNTGNVYVGEVELETEYPESLLSEIQNWKIVGN